jgi:hypothetical protein
MQVDVLRSIYVSKGISERTFGELSKCGCISVFGLTDIGHFANRPVVA